MAFGVGNNKVPEDTMEGFLDEVAGEGLNALKEKDLRSQLYLNITADLSEAVKSGIAGVGEWYVSGGTASLGKKVEVIVLGVKSIWAQRDKTGLTTKVGEPGSFKVREVKNDKGYLRMEAENGEEVVSLIMYALLLKQAPEIGPVLFQAGLGNIKKCRQWNTLLGAQQLPSGKPAPIYGRVWELEIGDLPSKTKPGTMYSGLKTITPREWIVKEMYLDSVKPSIQSAQLMLTSGGSQLQLEDMGASDDEPVTRSGFSLA